jgi:hypothetical protein
MVSGHPKGLVAFDNNTDVATSADGRDVGGTQMISSVKELL